MLKAIIIDDEIQSRENLSELIRLYCREVEIICEADSVNAGVEALGRNQPDIVFLDIKMGDGNGFDLLNRLTTINFEVVFITAYDQYAIKAFRFSALDYLLKPINYLELREAVSKVSEKRKNKTVNQKLNVFLQNQMDSNSNNLKIALPDRKGLIFVKLKDILYCKAHNNYTEFILANGNRIMVTKTIGEYEDVLSGHNFFRVHKSSLVNMNHLVKFVREDGGYILMSDNARVELSKRKKAAFLQHLTDL